MKKFPIRQAVAVGLCFLIFMINGCSVLGPSGGKIQYYTLEYDPPSLSKPKQLGDVLRIERFAVAPLYDTMRIVYRENEFKLNNYEYHRWRVNPGDMFASFVIRDFRQSGLFKAVLSKSSHLDSTHSLEGIVEELYEVDHVSGWQAVLGLEIVLTDDRADNIVNRIIFQKHYRVVERCEQNTPQGVVEALSRAMSIASRNIITDVGLSLGII